MGVAVHIHYTDGEVVNEVFEDLKQVLDYLEKEIVEKKEVVDDIEIHID